MPNRPGFHLIIGGSVLIISALLLFSYNEYQDFKARQQSESSLVAMQSAISNNNISPSINVSAENREMNNNAELPEVEIEGYDYIGYLVIKKLNIELPIMSQWDYTKLKIAPCRQFGSSRTNDLVIAAHNYSSHFGQLKNMQLRDEITFTDMDGIINNYSIAVIEVLNPTAVEEVQNSDYDLVLYTCTLSGKTRVTIFANRISE